MTIPSPTGVAHLRLRRRQRSRWAAAAAPLLCTLACSVNEPPGARVLLDFTRKDGLYSAPWPADDLLKAGLVDTAALPDARQNALLLKLLALLQGTRGFATTGAVFFALDGPVAPASLPTLTRTIAGDAPVFLIGIDPQSADYLRRIPLDVGFLRDGGPFGAPNLLVALPLQGFPLRPATRYAAIVRRSLRDANGRRLSSAGFSSATSGAGGRPSLAAALQDLGVPLDDIAGFTTFTTGEPAADLAAVRADALLQPQPLPLSPPSLRATYDDHCLYGTTVRMPVYQRGTPPYSTSGGGFVFDPAGRPVLQRFEEANLFVTVPRAAVPIAGWPLVVYIRAGGGGEVPLADRGPHKTDGGSAEPGSGLAKHFAQAGWAAIQVDGPLGGKRNPTNADEQFTIFNVANPEALRDNVRQNAVELAALAKALDRIAIDTSGCAGHAGTFAVDLGHVALFGHSTGATIAPLSLASEPRFRAGLLSGAGGSWIENIIEKKKPLDVRPLAELLLGYTDQGRTLTRHDPVLTLFQWALEPADPQVYARRVLREPDDGAPARHVLMLQGIVDHYILPRIANTISASLGLDLAGAPLDQGAPELASTLKALEVMTLGGRGLIGLPAQANHAGVAGGQVTAVLVQHLADGIEDGHEVLFQTEPPKHQLRCFLSTFARGVPRVSGNSPVAAACE